MIFGWVDVRINKTAIQRGLHTLNDLKDFRPAIIADRELIRKIYLTLTETPEYKTYINNPSREKSEEKKILEFIFLQIKHRFFNDVYKHIKPYLLYKSALLFPKQISDSPYFHITHCKVKT